MTRVIKAHPKFMRFNGRLKRIGRGIFFRKSSFMAKGGRYPYTKIRLDAPPCMTQTGVEKLRHSIWPPAVKRPRKHYAI